MREILFRGKRLGDNEWVDGSLFVDDKGDKHEILVGYVNYRVSWEVDPETVGQFTGLTDKNGRKIFEGDIIKYLDEDVYPEAVVKFEAWRCSWVGFYLDWDGLGLRPDLGFWAQEREISVIGNIYDNPENQWVE